MTDKELLEKVKELESVAYDLYRALHGAVYQLKMSGVCVQDGRYDEALLHARSLPREKREALERYEAITRAAAAMVKE